MTVAIVRQQNIYHRFAYSLVKRGVHLHPVRVHRYHSTNLKKLHCIILVTATDPCMGSGHILVYAFEVLMQIYESAGYSQRDAVRSILENNPYGLNIDDRAYQMEWTCL